MARAVQVDRPAARRTLESEGALPRTGLGPLRDGRGIWLPARLSLLGKSRRERRSLARARGAGEKSKRPARGPQESDRGLQRHMEISCGRARQETVRTGEAAGAI